MNSQYEDLDDIVLEVIKNNKVKLSDKELLFVFPIIAQVVAANRTIDVLMKARESACLGLICRQIFEMLVSLEYVYSNYHLKPDSFSDFCKYFTEHNRIGRYSNSKKKWVDVSIELLCENYIKHTGNKMVKESYDALCQMTHFSLMHTKESVCINGDTLEINLSGIRDDSGKICNLANTVRTELTRLIAAAIRREYEPNL